MKFKYFLLSVWLIVLTAGCRHEVSRKAVRFESCLNALTNVNAFAVAPCGKNKMISSYDRSGGNSDWLSARPLMPGNLLELAHLEGPGCLNRIWFTSLGAEEWLFFFDGESEPRLRCTSQELPGNDAGMPFRSPLSDRSSGGAYSYLPLPYEKSLRVVIKTRPFAPADRRYFHLNYETYPKGTMVTSYPKELTPKMKSSIATAARSWSDTAAAIVNHQKPEFSGNGHLNAGETLTWFEHDGSAVISECGFRLKNYDSLTETEKSHLLRELVLRCYWDGESAAGVEVPFGDFFCNAFHAREFASLPLSYKDGVYTCRFPMPFLKGARATVSNDGTTPVDIEWFSKVSPLNRSADYRSFHAYWSQSRIGGKPHQILQTSGRGHFVGCYLNVISMDGTWNILEGDEAIYVDGEVVPSWHGTGLEDYFNGAWYYMGLFDLPLHGLLEKAPIRTGQYRFHLNDRIGFDKKFKMTFEFGAGNSSAGYMSSVAYWYQEKPASLLHSLPDVSKRFPRADPLEKAGIMGELFELERIGHLTEAENRCSYYAEKYADTDLGKVMELRALAYKERLAGFSVVQPYYQQIAAQSKFSSASQQAKALLFLHSAPKNALLATHVNARYKLYLDGKPVAAGDDPVNLHIRPLIISEGRHELTAEVTRSRCDDWFSMCLRTSDGDIKTDSSWERTHIRPKNWPSGDDPDAKWSPAAIFNGADMLPRMNFWKFSPNAFVEMQGGTQLLRPWRSWPAAEKKTTVYLRRVFSIKGNGS